MVEEDSLYCGHEVIITGELERRPSRAPDYQAEARALAALAEAMSNSPDTVLQKLVEEAMTLTACESAGISLLESDGEHGTFRWAATAGAWADYRGESMPREQSPCGEVIARQSILLMDKPERAFPALLQATPAIREGLLAPFYIADRPAGTIWLVKHREEAGFDAEDARLLASLARSASAAHQMILALKHEEAGRLESDNRLRALARASSDVFYVMSPDMRELRALAGGDFIPDTTSPSQAWLDDYIPAEDHPATLAAIEDAIRRKGVFELEHRVRHGDQSLGWALSRAVPILDARGEIVEWFGSAADISPRKHAEARLRDSEQRQAFMLKLSDALAPVGEAPGGHIIAMRVLAEHLGVHRAEYFELGSDGATVLGLGGYAVGLPPMTGRFRVGDFGVGPLQAYVAGRVFAFDDASDLPMGEVEREAYKTFGIQSVVGAPILENGALVAVLVVSHGEVRTWSEEDISIITEVAQRTWMTVKRGRAEAAHRESEDRLRQFGEASQDVLWIRDAETFQWEYLTSAFETIYGLDRESALGGDNMVRWLNTILPEDRESAAHNLQRLREGERLSFEYRIRRLSDGRIRWLRNTGFPIHDARGRVVRLGGIGHDITALKEIEAALAAAEKRQRALLDGIPQLVWRAVDGGQWTWASPQWTDFTGQAEEDSHGPGWLEQVHPADHPEVRALWESAIERGGFDAEYRIRHAANGRYHWFQTRATPVRDDHGDIVEWLGTSTDVDDLRSLQERQAVLVGELQHRTRNLLGVIRSIADKTGAASADLPDFRNRFQDRLAALARVQGLLSRLNDEHDRVTFDDLIRSELAAMDSPDEQVELSGPAGVRLRSSMVQILAMALHELATNAVKYGALGQPQGRLQVSWSLEPQGPGEPPWLHIEWRESGVVMPAPAAPPGGGGQGRELIERALPYQLNARTAYALGPDGVRCSILIPVSASSTLSLADKGRDPHEREADAGSGLP